MTTRQQQRSFPVTGPIQWLSGFLKQRSDSPNSSNCDLFIKFYTVSCIQHCEMEPLLYIPLGYVKKKGKSILPVFLSKDNAIRLASRDICTRCKFSGQLKKMTKKVIIQYLSFLESFNKNISLLKNLLFPHCLQVIFPSLMVVFIYF